MKISKDLADAVMMVACIVLVLIGTTTFESASTKAILMTVMAVFGGIYGRCQILGREKTDTLTLWIKYNCCYSVGMPGLSVAYFSAYF